MDEAKQLSIRQCQSIEFEEYAKVQKKGHVSSKSSKLRSLNPYIDSNGLIRVLGRLEHAELSEDTKHPICLPHKSHFTDLVIADAHLSTLHGGPQLMLNYLRTSYWIVGAKSLVKNYVHKCVRCLRFSARNRCQLMGPLPSYRVQLNRPFLRSGVDYAGPIQVRASKGRGHSSYKGYICVFVCMVTRAIHIELVSDLTSQGFLSAFKRFVARRGHVAEIWSDNGTNFVDAARELQILFTAEKSGILKKSLNR